MVATYTAEEMTFVATLRSHSCGGQITLGEDLPLCARRVAYPVTQLGGLRRLGVNHAIAWSIYERGYA